MKMVRVMSAVNLATRRICARKLNGSNHAGRANRPHLRNERTNDKHQKCTAQKNVNNHSTALSTRAYSLTTQNMKRKGAATAHCDVNR